MHARTAFVQPLASITVLRGELMRYVHSYQAREFGCSTMFTERHESVIPIGVIF